MHLISHSLKINNNFNKSQDPLENSTKSWQECFKKFMQMLYNFKLQYNLLAFSSLSRSFLNKNVYLNGIPLAGFPLGSHTAFVVHTKTVWYSQKDSHPANFIYVWRNTKISMAITVKLLFAKKFWIHFITFCMAVATWTSELTFARAF